MIESRRGDRGTSELHQLKSEVVIILIIFLDLAWLEVTIKYNNLEKTSRIQHECKDF